MVLVVTRTQQGRGVYSSSSTSSSSSSSSSCIKAGCIASRARWGQQLVQGLDSAPTRATARAVARAACRARLQTHLVLLEDEALGTATQHHLGRGERLSRARRTSASCRQHRDESDRKHSQTLSGRRAQRRPQRRARSPSPPAPGPASSTRRGGCASSSWSGASSAQPCTRCGRAKQSAGETAGRATKAVSECARASIPEATPRRLAFRAGRGVCCTPRKRCCATLREHFRLGRGAVAPPPARRRQQRTRCPSKRARSHACTPPPLHCTRTHTHAHALALAAWPFLLPYTPPALAPRPVLAAPSPVARLLDPPCRRGRDARARAHER